jgi:hypothetical protein
VSVVRLDVMTTDVVTTIVASDEGNVNKSEKSYVFAMLEGVQYDSPRSGKLTGNKGIKFDRRPVPNPITLRRDKIML